MKSARKRSFKRKIKRITLQPPRKKKTLNLMMPLPSQMQLSKRKPTANQPKRVVTTTTPPMTSSNTRSKSSTKSSNSKPTHPKKRT